MSNKFKVGDRIKTPASDRVGYCYASVTSVDTEVTPYHTESVYTVVWEHHNYSSHQYKASEVDSLWKLADICLAVDMTIKLPTRDVKILSQIYKLADVQKIEYVDSMIILNVKATTFQADRIKRLMVKIPSLDKAIS